MPVEDLNMHQHLRFFLITPEVMDDLEDIWKVIHPHLPQIVQEFYESVQSHDDLAILVSGLVDSLSSAQIIHWERLFTSRFDSNYFESVRAIGRAHYRVKLSSSWYMGGYQFFQACMSTYLINKYKFKTAKLNRYITSLNKAIMLDMELAISALNNEHAEERLRKVEAMSRAVTQFEGNVSSVIASVNLETEKMRTTASALENSANTADEQAVEASSASNSTAEKVQSVSNATGELTTSIAEISKRLAGATEIAQKAAKGANESATSVQNLADSANKIGNIVSLIQDIAEQTNLLALNATIEAARAGEAGRGFAVVAQEVKDLATQTGSATGEIARQVMGIQQETSDAVTSITSIATIMSEINDITSAIASSVEEQGAATAEISSNIRMVADGTEQLSHNFSMVEQAINMTKTSVQDVNMASNSLSEQSVCLTGQVKQFFDNLDEFRG